MGCNESCHKPNRTQAHCTVCHRTFTGTHWFDVHRRGGRCVALEGFVEIDGIWASQASHAHRARSKQRMLELLADLDQL